MASKNSKSASAFTLVEMIIVLTILAILSVAAMMDYGLSIKKARLQIAVEELVSLFHEGEVYAQSRYVQVEEAPVDDTLYCWAVEVGASQTPRLVRLPWDSSAQECTTDFQKAEATHTLSWHPQLAIDSMEWTTTSSSGSVEGTAKWMGFLFIPPQGTIEVYLDSTAPTLLEEVSSVQLYFSYGGSDMESLTKIVEITPVTSKFVVTPGGATSP